MKHGFPSTRLRQGLTLGLLGLFFSGSFYLAPRNGAGPAASSYSHLLENEAEEEEEEGPKQDRPDLAMLQDIELTRDPATGQVPRERLLAAAEYNERTLVQQRLTSGTLAAANWTERGPTNVAGRIRGILIDPADATGNTLWAGSAGGGLWKATNATTGNVQWTNVNSFLTHLSVSTVASTPAGTSPQVLYCGTGEGFLNADAIQGAGIWKSTDGGATWSQLPSTNNANFYHVQKVLVHPATLDVYAATRTGLYRSQNAGASWTPVLSIAVTPGAVTSRVADIEITSDNTLFASLGLSSTDGIYRSPTGAAGSWTKLNTLTGSGLPTSGYERIELACAPSDANRVYAVFENTSNGLLNIYRSVDKGDTWTAMSRPGATTANPTFDFTRGQAWYDLIAAVSPTDPNLMYVGGVDLWRTINAGEANATQATWTQASFWNIAASNSRFVHADHHAIAFIPTATGPANQAFFGNDGGIFYTANASAPTGTTVAFASRNSGLNVTQYYALAMHPTNYNYFLAGSQDNGTQRFISAGLNATTTATGGDGGFCAIDQLNPSVQISSYVYNQYFRSINGGNNFTSVNISSTKGAFINPFDYDSRNGVLYGAYSNDTCMVWTNAGSRVQAAAVTINNRLGVGIGRITHVAVSPRAIKRIYVGTSNGTVLRVDSASTTAPVVNTLRPASPGTSVSCIAVDPANEDHMLLTYSNYGIVSVYETRNALSRTPTWTSVEGSLPDMPVRWALIDPNNSARAILATEMGVYSTELLSGNATVWTPANSTLANTRIDMLRYRAGDQLVSAATHGRGLYTSDLFATNPLANKAAKPSMIGSVYPNPFTTEVNVELAQKAVGPVAISLTDALGRQVFANTLTPNGTQLKLTLPASLAPGNYVLVVRNNGQLTSRRVVKH